MTERKAIRERARERRILEEERFRAQEGELAWVEADTGDYDPPKTPEHRCACITVDIQAAHWSNCPNRENRVETSDDLG